MDLSPLEPRHLETWRRRYREQLSLPVIPDFHEALCRMGKAFAVEEAGHTLGYAFLTEEGIIPSWAPVVPEFYLALEPARSAKRLLQAVFEKLQPKTVVGRTDDASGFPLLMDLHLPNQVSSPLYRLDKSPAWAEDPNLTVIVSTLDDARRLLPIYSSVATEDGGIPDEMSLLKSLALWRHYRLMSGGEAVAVCYVVPQGQKYITAVPIVAEAQRAKGYGRYLVSFALRRELAEGKQYVATVHPDNEAGRGLVESLGARLAAHFVNFTPVSRYADS